MILARVIIDGKSYDENKTYSGTGTTLQKYVAMETLKDDYEDISSIENWDVHGYKTEKDYKFIRNEIINCAWTKMQGNSANWDNLSVNEKKISIQWFSVPKELRDTLYSLDEQIVFGSLEINFL